MTVYNDQEEGGAVALQSQQPQLIVIGGFAGTGKTTLTRRLSSELGIPRLGADTIGRTIRNSQGMTDGAIDAYWVAYDMLFRLCEEFLQAGISTILDLNLAWAFQWHHLDRLHDRYPACSLVPFLLRCSRELCLARIRDRHAQHPTYYAPPELFMTDQKHLQAWDFLQQLERPDINVLDAAKPQDELCAAIRQRLTTA